MARVVLAMSGGVDSSVAAHLLVRQGHEVIGLFMRHGESTSTCSTEKPNDILPVISRASVHKQGCCTASDAADARRVADRLGIDFYALDFRDEFGRIIDYFVDEYQSGRTPNPCIACNNWIKFGALWDYAEGVSADYIATGHYARLRNAPDGHPALLRGRDADKDQSYVLFGIERSVLPKLLFPVGDYRKQDIRSMAREVGLAVADKRDSQEICFVPDGDHTAFIQNRTGADDHSGDIVTTDGTVVGHHDGVERFTIGQRKGLRVALGEPHFVIDIDPESRRVVVGRREQLACSALTADRVNWLVDRPRESFDCVAQIRYNSAASPARVIPNGDGHIDVEFAEPQFGVAPGQAVVCYDGDRILGGAWISSRKSAHAVNS